MDSIRKGSFPFFITVSLLFIVVPYAMAVDMMHQYVKKPLFSETAKPSVMLLLDNSGSMKYRAYQHQAFDPKRSYFGIFEPKGYYRYLADKKYYEQCSAQKCGWSGNFLNWASTRRIDVAKLVLTGGVVVKDGTDTVLQADQWANYAFDVRYDDSSPKVDLNGISRHMTPYQCQLVIKLQKTTSDPRQPGKQLLRIQRSETSTLLSRTVVQRKMASEDLPVTGLIQDSSADIRYGLTLFPKGGKGGTVRKYVGSSPESIIEEINNTDTTAKTPLAESLYTITGYFQQHEPVNQRWGPRYHGEALSYQVDEQWDPFYFNEKTSDNLVSCSQAFALILTDGEPWLDTSIPRWLRDYDRDGNDRKYQNYVDDVALYAHTRDLRPSLAGFQNLTIYTVFVFGSAVTPSRILVETAINGGFDDKNGNGRVDPDEISLEEDGYPKNLFAAGDGYALSDALIRALEDIKRSTVTATSTSVTAGSVDGTGTVCSSVFYPALTDNNNHHIVWAGDVRALFLDSDNNYREDSWTSGIRGQLDMVDDLIVKTVINNESDTTTATLYKDSNGNGVLDAEEKKTPVTTKVPLKKLSYVWSAGNWLSHLDNSDIVEQRRAYISNERKRYIFTYIDKNNNKQVDRGEYLPFTVEELANSSDMNKNFFGFLLGTDTGTVANIDGSADEIVDIKDAAMLIDYIRGKEYSPLRFPHLRSRKFETAVEPGQGAVDNNSVWRLGDIVHSAPVTVQQPFAGYDTVYNSKTYRSFKKRYGARRTMIYTGSNDGIFHAFNGGFYQSLYLKRVNGKQQRIAKKIWAYCDRAEAGGKLICYDYSERPEAPALGQEMWAYIPQNLLPHLQWLPQKDYKHIYYNDLTPVVFEAQLWDKNNDPVHIGGWGTILVGGMRFGGGPIEIDANLLGEADKRIMRSAYFVFDITDPELPPVLLDEITLDLDKNFSFTTVKPSLEYVTRTGQTEQRDWYLVFGSGPDSFAGSSDQKARIFVRKLNQSGFGQTRSSSDRKFGPFGKWIKGDSLPEDEFHLVELNEPQSFIGQFHGSDFQIGSPDLSPGAFTTDAIYFGTVSGSFGSWGGKIYRLVVDAPGKSAIVASDPATWRESILFDPKRPISTKPQVTLDEKENVWVLFGTGRFYQADIDREYTAPSMQLYGVRESMVKKKKYGYIPRYKDNAVSAEELFDSTRIGVYAGTSDKKSALSGDKLRYLTDIDGVNGKSFYDLEKTIGRDWKGWFVTLDQQKTDFEGERVITDPLLYSQMINFNTFMASKDVCESSGDGYGYLLYYKTGTAYYRPIMGVHNDQGIIIPGEGEGQIQNLVKKTVRIGGASAAPGISRGENGTVINIPNSSGGNIAIPVELPGPGKSRRIFWKNDWN